MTDKLREAAQAIVDRWDSPAWGGSAENLRHTGECIAELRAALAQQDAQAELPIIRQNKLLADALASCILASGIVRTDIDGLTGPQLLLFAEDLREMLEAKTAQQDAQAVQHKFLANGTRFKMSFFQNEDGEGNAAPGTHVTCFEAFEDELDGRWVALVPAEDDCHLNTAPTPPAPPPEARQWTGLTDIGVYSAITAAGNPPNPMSEEFFAWCEKFADAIEANLKERNA